MANSYSQLYVHLVFAVAGRQSLIPDQYADDLRHYMAGLIRYRGHTPIVLNGPADHIHILFGLNPDMAISSLVREIKSASSRFINRSGWLRTHFNWQEGYGAFSHSHEELPRVTAYITRQREHHARRTFRDEFIQLLKTQRLPFDERYLFEWVEEESPGIS